MFKSSPEAVVHSENVERRIGDAHSLLLNCMTTDPQRDEAAAVNTKNKYRFYNRETDDSASLEEIAEIHPMVEILDLSEFSYITIDIPKEKYFEILRAKILSLKNPKKLSMSCMVFDELPACDLTHIEAIYANVGSEDGIDDLSQLETAKKFGFNHMYLFPATYAAIGYMTNDEPKFEVINGTLKVDLLSVYHSFFMYDHPEFKKVTRIDFDFGALEFFPLPWNRESFSNVETVYVKLHYRLLEDDLKNFLDTFEGANKIISVYNEKWGWEE